MRTKIRDLQAKISELLSTGRTDSSVTSLIEPGGSLSRQEAIQVYQRAYVARLTEALGETFEGVWRVLGDSEFFAVAEAYIRETPSCSYNLSAYGSDFPAYLKRQSWDELEFLFDLATFELCFREIFHSRAEKPMDRETLSALLQEDRPLLLSSALRALQTENSIYDFWKKKIDECLDLSSIGHKKPSYLVLYKRERQVFIRSLSRGQYGFFQGMLEGLSFPKLVAEFTDQLDEEEISDLVYFLFESELVIGERV